MERSNPLNWEKLYLNPVALSTEIAGVILLSANKNSVPVTKIPKIYLGAGLVLDRKLRRVKRQLLHFHLLIIYSEDKERILDTDNQNY